MTTKINTNTTIKNIELFQSEKEPVSKDQKHDRLSICGANFIEGQSATYTIYGHSDYVSDMLNFAEDLISGNLTQYDQWIFLYKTITTKLDQKVVGYINSSHPKIMEAIDNKWEKFNFVIPQLGVNVFSLKKAFGINEYYRMVQTFNSISLLPASRGNIVEKLHMATAFFKGSRLLFDVSIRYSHDYGTFHRSVHDNAQRLYEMATDPKFDWVSYHQEKKEKAFETKRMVRAHNNAERKVSAIEKQPEKVAKVTTVCILDGKETNLLEIPEGSYAIIDKSGKNRFNCRIVSDLTRFQLADLGLVEKIGEKKVVRLVTRQ